MRKSFGGRLEAGELDNLTMACGLHEDAGIC